MRTGQLIAGRYRLEEQVGTGAMGVVWRAYDEKLDRMVALKRAVRSVDDDNGRARRQIRREARNAAKLRHPHVVTFIEEVVESRERWLVMEYVPAQSLAQILEQTGPLRPGQVAHIGAQIASALEAVHAKDIVHRDVKPGNILITEDGTAKLTDFGISRAIHGDVTMTDVGVISGTVAFLASEVADGQEATPASDVFALGATLFAAVEGTPPFGTADNPLLVLRRAAAGDLLPVNRAGPLTPVLAALLRPDPAQRPDAAAARQMLQELAGTSIGGAGSWWPAGTSARSRRSRRRAVTAAGACLAALAIAAGIVVTRADGLAGPLPTADPRTADPCALTDIAVLERFGATTRETARGNFNRCDVIVKSGSGSQVDVKVELVPPAGATIDGPGPVQVIPQPENGDGCVRTVLVAGQHQVTDRIAITAKLEPGSTPADLCAMAEAATTHAVTVLSRGPIPRRVAPFNAASLAWTDACTLLDPGALGRVLGTGLSGPEVGFGEWRCRWKSATSTAAVTVHFDRNAVTTPLVGRATTIGGRDAGVDSKPDKPECEVWVAHRQDFDGADKPVKEWLRINVRGPQPSDQLCGPAQELGEAAVAKLPG